MPYTGVLDWKSCNAYTSWFERTGWRAESVALLGGSGYIEVRDMAIRHHPKIATLRTHEDVAAFRQTHPAHGLIGRVPTTKEAKMPLERPDAHGKTHSFNTSYTPMVPVEFVSLTTLESEKEGY
jgi:hypothetical protein